MARKLEVEIVGNASKLNKELNKATGQTGRFGSKLGGLQKVAGLAAGAAGLGAFVGALKSTIDAAQESEVSQKKMQTQLKALGISYGAHAKEIDKVIQKTSQLSGLDDEDLQDAFTNIVRTTGSVSQSLKLTGLAADFARAKHMDVAKAGELVAKVAGGNTGILAKYGVTIDKNASSSEALAALQAKFAGQAQAYGDTAAGAQDKFRVATENLQEAIGEKLLPIVTKITTAATDFILQMQNGEGAGGKFRKALNDIGDTFSAIWNAMQPLVAAVLPGLIRQLKGFGESIHGVLMIIKGIFTGDFGTIWAGVKEIFRGAIDTLLGRLQTAVAPFKSAGRALGNAIMDGIRALIESFKDTGGWITNRIAEGIKGVTESLTSAASWIRARVVEFVHNEVSGFSNLGGWVVGRFVDGIKASTKAISDAAGWLKDQVVNAVKKFFGISSPAKVMIELGGHISAGLIKGIVGKDVPGFIGRHFGGISKLAGKLLSSGWSGLKDFFGGKAQPGTPGVGGPISHGLVAQVVNALAWARSHGWHGIVTSGFRTYAEQAALYARYLAGGPLAARPGTSSHESGQAVDVTDPAGFAKALAGAPPGAKLYNRLGAADPVHFSVSGYAGGTPAAMRGWHWVGERGPELVNFNGGETVLSNSRSMSGGGQVIVQHHYHGPVVQDKQLLTMIRNMDRGFTQRNGKPAFGGTG